MKTKLIIIAVSAFLFLAVHASAQQNNVSKTDSSKVNSKKCPNYVDKNNDGVCDNWQSSKTNQTVKSKNYVDANKDGICDNRQNNNTRNCCGNGYGYGKGKCNGNGCQHRHGWRNKKN